MVDTEVTTKVCSKCGKEKVLVDFGKHKRSKYGVRAACKECIRAYNNLNKDRIKEYKRLYYERNKGSHKVNCKRYYEENREDLNLKNKINREANKEVIRVQRQKYAKENRHVFNYHSSKRRVIKAGSTPKHLVDCKVEKGRLNNIYRLSKIISISTGIPHHVDHMWPLADGGPHWSGNLQIIPAKENLEKHTKVCEGVKNTVKEALEWEIQRYNNERANIRDS